MINKLKFPDKKYSIIAASVLVLVIALVVTYCVVFNAPKEGEIVYDDPSKIEVSKAEMEEYRLRIGTDMDIKKTILILFEDEGSCRNFIDSHGADENPAGAGIGIIPLMEDGYYNIVGKQSLEDAFDSLGDGEYSKEPVIYSNMYCYLKRIGIDSPMKDDKALKEFIQNEKYQELKKDGE